MLVSRILNVGTLQEGNRGPVFCPAQDTHRSPWAYGLITGNSTFCLLTNPKGLRTGSPSALEAECQRHSPAQLRARLGRPPKEVPAAPQTQGLGSNPTRHRAPEPWPWPLESRLPCELAWETLFASLPPWDRGLRSLHSVRLTPMKVRTGFQRDSLVFLLENKLKCLIWGDLTASRGGTLSDSPACKNSHWCNSDPKAVRPRSPLAASGI